MNKKILILGHGYVGDYLYNRLKYLLNYDVTIISPQVAYIQVIRNNSLKKMLQILDCLVKSLRPILRVSTRTS